MELRTSLHAKFSSHNYLYCYFLQAVNDGYRHHSAAYGQHPNHAMNPQQPTISAHNPNISSHNPIISSHNPISAPMPTRPSNMPLQQQTLHQQLPPQHPTIVPSHPAHGMPHPGHPAHSSGLPYGNAPHGGGGGAYHNNPMMPIGGAPPPVSMMGSNICTPDSTSLIMSDSESLDGGIPHPLAQAPFRPTMSPLLSSGRIEQTQAFTWIRRHLIPCEDASVPKQEVYDAYK